MTSVLPEHPDDSDKRGVKVLEVCLEELVRALFAGLLGREPDADALQWYSAQLGETQDMLLLVSDIVGRDECWQKMLEVRSEKLVHTV